MSKKNQKGGKSESEVAETSGAGIIFEVMPDDFKPAIKAQQGQWDAIVTKACTKEFAGKFITVYKSPADNPEPCYTRSKGVRKALKKLGLKGVVAVRQMDENTVLLLQGEAGTPKAVEE